MRNYTKVKHIGLEDYVFKKVFSNKRILSAYLKELGIEVLEEQLVFEVLELKNDIDSKGVRFDIRIRDKNTRINLEAQRYNISGKDKAQKIVSSLEYQNHRKIHYISVLHSEAYKQGEQYFEKPKSYVIFFLENKSSENWIERTKLINLETKEIYDDIEIIEIVLKNIKGDATLKERMFKVFIEKDLKEYVKERTIVGEVAKMICEINAKEKRRALKIFKEQQERVARDARELRENEIYFKGEEEGRQKNALATAKRLKTMGFSVEVIAEATCLSEEEILKL